MLEDMALMRVLPNMSVIAPSDAVQTKKIVHLMVEKNGPMYSRVGRDTAPIIYDKNDVDDLRIGKGMVVEEGTDIAFICCGTTVETALMARKTLLQQGISSRIIDMHTIKPLDVKLVIKCARDTKAIITAEEHSIIGGLGAAVAEILAESSHKTKFLRMGIKDVFCESGSPVDLLEKYELNEKFMIKNAKNLLKG
jgi:transketolase